MDVYQPRSCVTRNQAMPESPTKRAFTSTLASFAARDNVILWANEPIIINRSTTVLRSYVFYVIVRNRYPVASTARNSYIRAPVQPITFVISPVQYSVIQ